MIPQTALRIASTHAPAAWVGYAGRRRSAVVHVYAGPKPTPASRARRGARPVCGARSRAWSLRTSTFDRRLCARCASWAAARQRPAPPIDKASLTVDDIRASLLAAVSLDEVEACVGAVIRSDNVMTLTTRADGTAVPLSGLLGEIRRALRSAGRVTAAPALPSLQGAVSR